MSRSAARVEVTGIADARKALRAAGRDLADLKAAGLEAGEIVVDEARRIVPVLSGALEQTIRAAGIASGAVVRAGFAAVPYAGVIHFGWAERNIEPYPFLYDAIDLRASEIVDAYQRQIDDIASRFN